MIRTLGFLTGIVVTGTALALLTDPGVVRPALDSLAGSIRQPGNEQIATQAPTQAPTQAQAQKGPAAGILPPARLMQRPDSPIEAADGFFLCPCAAVPICIHGSHPQGLP